MIFFSRLRQIPILQTIHYIYFYCLVNKSFEGREDDYFIKDDVVCITFYDLVTNIKNNLKIRKVSVKICNHVQIKYSFMKIRLNSTWYKPSECWCIFLGIGGYLGFEQKL